MRNKEDLVRTAKEVIFGDAVNLIAETNRDMFIQTFVNHFRNYENPFYDVEEWGEEIDDVLYTNYAYINAMYEIAKKGIFSKYSVTKMLGNTTSNNSGEFSNTNNGSATANDSSTSTSENSGTNTSTRGLNSSNTSQRDLRDSTSNTGSTTTTDKGTVKDATSGTDTDSTTKNLTNTFTPSGEKSHEVNHGETTAFTPTGEKSSETSLGETSTFTPSGSKNTTVNYGSSSTTTPTGEKTTEQIKGSVDTTTPHNKQGASADVSWKEGSITKSGVVSEFSKGVKEYTTVKMSDTPQNQLAGVDNDAYLSNYSKTESGAVDPNGKDRTTQNMSETYNGYKEYTQHNTITELKRTGKDATVEKFSNYNEKTVKGGSDSTSESYTNYNERTAKGGKNVTTDKFASYKELTTKGGKDVTTEKFANYKEVTAQGGTESTTHEKNSSNTRTSDMVNKVTNDTSQASTHTGSVTDTKSDTENIKAVDSATGKVINKGEKAIKSLDSASGTSSSNGTVRNDVTSETFEYHYEMMIKAESLMNNVWDLFKKCFLSVY